MPVSTCPRILKVSLPLIVLLLIEPLLTNFISSDLFTKIQSLLPLPVRLLIFTIIFALCSAPVVMEKYHKGKNRLRNSHPWVTKRRVVRRVRRCPKRNADSDTVVKLLLSLCKEGLRIESPVYGALTVHTEQKVPDVEAALQYDHTKCGSQIVYKAYEWGPQIGPDTLRTYSSQIEEALNYARKLDKNCTFQFGSFALFKYQDEELICVRLQEDWTPRITEICRSPWNIFTGQGPKWIIKGSNLQNATLRASTSNEKEEIFILESDKMEGGEDVLLCVEPGLIRRSVLKFWKGVHICAWISMTSEGVDFDLQSESKDAKIPYCLSVVKGFIPSLKITVIMTILGATANILRVSASTLLVLCFIVVIPILAYWCFTAKQVPPSGCDFQRIKPIEQTENSGESDKVRRRRPPGLKKLNGSLYQLYAPKSGTPDVDIIFFHGLEPLDYRNDYRNAFWESWMSENGKMFWPQALLGKEFPNARILSVSYDSAVGERAKPDLDYIDSAVGERAKPDLDYIAEHLLEDIIDFLSRRGNRPIVLVGHSLGGVVIMLIVNMASRIRGNCDPEVSSGAQRIARIDTFLDNLCGIFFYSTPHVGTKLADIASEIPGRSEVLIFLRTIGEQLSIVSDRFVQWRKKAGVYTSSLCEGRPTDPKIWGVKGMKPTLIVSKASSSFYTDDSYIDRTADHITICQPDYEYQPGFRLLANFVHECLLDLTGFTH